VFFSFGGLPQMTIAPHDTAQPDVRVLREIESAVAAADFARASQLADAEIARGRSHPSLYSARAMQFERDRDDFKALLDYQRALLLAPGNVVLLNAVGLCLFRLFRFEEAIETFDRAIRTSPAHAPSYVRKGNTLRMAGKHEDARLAYARALKLDPSNAEAHACLAAMTALEGNVEQARKHAERALGTIPQEPTALAALALTDIAERNFVAAEERARAVLADSHVEGAARVSVLGILGDALDGQDRTKEAFTAWSAENMELLRTNAIRFAGRTRVAELAGGLAAFLEQSPAMKWKGAVPHQPADAAPAQHAFLLGFFRSGTTLLEQCLEAHSGIATLEERDCLEEPAERYLTQAAGLHELAALEGEQLESTRAEYWRGVHAAVSGIAGKVFVDKHPLNTLKLPLIARLFPEAKIIFAVRDPRDVVLSCFRRHFQVNAAMYEMLTLQGAAESYDAVMNLAHVARGRIGLELLEHRYEDLVGDFEDALRRICAFLGVDYEPQMADFGSVVRGGEIRSPSRFQVRRPLYRESVGQWRRYAGELEPVMPLLRRWIDQFAYPAE
jgi:Tfp pilus assembly protein PilF